MIKIEPTYLRYIYDGLNKGLINSQNASSLPNGFIGLFEEVFSSDKPVTERSKLLNKLGLWALFKGPVSCEFVSQILEENVEETKALVDEYSKWFNSPSPGKYILYHDRLRTYLLQKLSDHETQTLNEKIIKHLELAIKNNFHDETVKYSLEFLSTHMYIESQLDNNYIRFYEFVNDKKIWNKQIQVSKEYKWVQDGLRKSLKESSRRKNELNTLTSFVNSVNLYQEEESNIEQILELLIEEDYETAFNRIVSFDSKIQFHICLIVIHQFTIGRLKTSKSKLIICKKILSFIDEKKLEIDNKPVSGLAIFKYYEDLIELNLDAKILLKSFNFSYTALLHLTEYIDVSNESFLKIFHESDPFSQISICLKISQDFLSKDKKSFAITYSEKAIKILSQLDKKMFYEDHDFYSMYLFEIGGEIWPEAELNFYNIQNQTLIFAFDIFKKCDEINGMIKSIEIRIATYNHFKKLIFNKKDFLIKNTGGDDIFIGFFVRAENLVIDLYELARIKSDFLSIANLIAEDVQSLYTQLISYTNENYKNSDFMYLYSLKSEFILIHKAIYYTFKNELNKLDELLDNISDPFTKANVILGVYEKTEKSISFKYSEILKNIVLNLEFSSNLFLICNKCVEVFLFEKNQEFGLYYLNINEQLLERISNKKQFFYLNQIKEIISYYTFLENYQKIEFYLDQYINCLNTIEIPTNKTKRQYLQSLDLSKSKNLNVINHVIFYLKEKLKLDYIENLFERDIIRLELNKKTKDEIQELAVKYKNIDCLFKLNYSIPGWFQIGDNSNIKYEDFENYKRINLNILFNENSISKSLVFKNFLNNINQYTSIEFIYNELIFLGHYDIYINEIINDLFKTYKKGKDDFSQIKENYTICKELLKNESLGQGIRLINCFDLPLNILMSPIDRSNKNYFENITLEFLFDILKNNYDKVVIDKIFDFVKNLPETLNEKLSIHDRNYKFLGYKYITKKFIYLGYFEDAKNALRLALKQSPKNYGIGKDQSKQSGYIDFQDYGNPELIRYCQKLFDRNEFFEIINLTLSELGKFTRWQIGVINLLIDVKEDELALKIALSIIDKIALDPELAYDEARDEIRFNLCKTLYKLGKFDYADEIHNKIKDSQFSSGGNWEISKFEGKSEYYLEKKNYDKLFDLISSFDLKNQNERGFNYNQIIVVANKIFKAGEKEIFLKIIGHITPNLKTNVSLINNELIKNLLELNEKGIGTSLLKLRLKNILEKIDCTSKEIITILVENRNFESLFDTLKESFDNSSVFYENDFEKLVISETNENFNLKNYKKLNNSKKYLESLELSSIYDFHNTTSINFDLLSKYSYNKESLTKYLKNYSINYLFFNKNKNLEIDLISNVIDIEDWKKISSKILN